MVIRRGGRQDVRFLRDMLHHAYYWRERNPATGRARRRATSRAGGDPATPSSSPSTTASPSAPPGTGCSGATSPGYGFVDEETPELAIAVVPSRRGRGIGEALLEALCERARADGYGALSLSVERDNPALVSFYEEHGFSRRRGRRRATA